MLKNYSPRKIFFILFSSLFLSLFPLPHREASAWIDTIIPKVITPPMQTMLDQLMIMLTGAAKQAAVKMITQNVYSVIGGGSGGGGAKFIVNWQSALEVDPQREAAIFIESMSSMSTQMRGSISYRSLEGVGGSYMSSLSGLIGNMTSQSASFNKCPITYEGNLANMFADGTFKKSNNFMSGNNNPAGYKSCMQNAYEEKLASLKEIAKTRAIAYQGFIGTGVNGNITYPGSAVAAKLFNTENMGNLVITSANGIAEVIVSAVMKMGMDAMNNGIGNVQSEIQKGVSNVSEKASSQMQIQTTNSGPGKMFGN